MLGSGSGLRSLCRPGHTLGCAAQHSVSGPSADLPLVHQRANALSTTDSGESHRSTNPALPVANVFQCHGADSFLHRLLTLPHASPHLRLQALALLSGKVQVRPRQLWHVARAPVTLHEAQRLMIQSQKVS